MVDEKKTTEQEIKLEKQKLWNAALKERRVDVQRKLGAN